MPLSYDTQGAYLRVWFDTPFSEINIFDHPTAEQITEILAKVNPKVHKAVLFLTKKPASYINGVGLLLASAIKSVDEAVKLTGPTRAAYLAVKNCPVPTIAVVKGNCFGCGVEFIAHCTYRLAVDSLETTFYMTELPEYLFVPAFGGTQLLPQIVGLEKATDLVLWGEKWNAATAKRYGLVSDVLPLKHWEKALAKKIPDLLAHLPARKRAKKIHPTFWKGVERRLNGLPPAYQKPYLEAFRLLQTGATAEQMNELTARRELKVSAETVMRPESKNSLGFFFVRQSARLIAEKGRRESDPAILNVSLPKAALSWGKALVGAVPETFLFNLHSYAGKTKTASQGVFVETRNSESIPFLVGHQLPRKSKAETAAGIYWPGYQVNCRVVEIRNVITPEARADVAFCFHKMGFTTLVSQGEGNFFLDELWNATRRALNQFEAAGIAAETVVDSLCDFGFLDFPAQWAARFGVSLDSGVQAPEKRAWMRRLAKSPRAESPVVNEVVVKGLIGHWMATVAGTQSESKISHLAFADVAAREMVGFPLSHLSLTRFATKKWIRENLLGSTLLMQWLEPHVVDGLRRYTDSERDRTPRHQL